MKSTGEKLTEGTAVSLGGLVLFIVAMLSVGHIVVVFLFMALPFFIGYLVVSAIYGKRPVYVEGMAADKTSAAPVPKIAVKIIHAEGVCPKGYASQVGEAWLLNGKVEGETPLCPHAEGLLARSADEILRRRSPTTSRVNCSGKGHTMTFELKPAEEPALVGASN